MLNAQVLKAAEGANLKHGLGPKNTSAGGVRRKAMQLRQKAHPQCTPNMTMDSE